MRAITRELLKSFYRKSGSKPANIIMYRDGVGEGHFDIVMRWEGMQWNAATCRISLFVPHFSSTTASGLFADATIAFVCSRTDEAGL